MHPRLLRFLALGVVAALTACPIGGGPGGAGDDAGPADVDAGPTGVPDGPADRRACTDNFGHVVAVEFGRLDGILRAVVDPSNGPCRADNNHLHLQIEAAGVITDVAVNLDVQFFEEDHAPVDAWSDGWHNDASLDYDHDLGVHAAAFAAHGQSTIQSLIDAALTDANHISIYAKGYASDGIHDVHRNGGLRDGAIVIRPTEATAHYLMFRFPDQQF